MVEIQHIGKIEARFDTGNESYNALHAENIKVLSDGKRVKFKTVNDIILTRDIIDRKRINIGDNQKQDRIAISLDMTLSGTKYKGTKFTLADRSSNDFPVLIGQKFLARADIAVNVNRKKPEK